MRTAALLSAAALSIILAGPAPAADPPQKPQKDRSQQIVCKTDDYVGSHIPQRICKTRAEWDEAAKQAHQFLDRDRKLNVDGRSMCGSCGG